MENPFQENSNIED